MASLLAGFNGGLSGITAEAIAGYHTPSIMGLSLEASLGIEVGGMREFSKSKDGWGFGMRATAAIGLNLDMSPIHARLGYTQEINSINPDVSNRRGELSFGSAW